MQLQQEIGNKNQLIAEDYFQSDIVVSLCNLYIHPYFDSILYAVYESFSKKLVACALFHANQKCPWENLSFNKIIYLNSSASISILPSDFIEYKSSSSPDKPIFKFQQDTPNHKHLTEILFTSELSINSANHLYLFSEKTSVVMVYFHQGSLKFCNSFNIQSIEEITYFALSILESEDVQPDQVVLKLDYSLQEHYPELLKEINHYIPQSHWLEIKNESLNNTTLDIKNRFYFVQTLNECE